MSKCQCWCHTPPKFPVAGDCYPGFCKSCTTNKIICPKCEANGMTSCIRFARVFGGLLSTFDTQFHDEHGALHDHHYISGTSYECTNHHCFIFPETRKNNCSSCGNNWDKTIEEIFNGKVQ